jgi:hypothetical protein
MYIENESAEIVTISDHEFEEIIEEYKGGDSRAREGARATTD